MNVNWRLKICSTRKPEMILQNLSQLKFEGGPVPAIDDKKVHLSLVVTDRQSKKSMVVRGWTAAVVPPSAPPVPLTISSSRYCPMLLQPCSSKCLGGKPEDLKMIGERNSMVSEEMYQRLNVANPPPCTLQVIQCMVPQRSVQNDLLHVFYYNQLRSE